LLAIDDEPPEIRTVRVAVSNIHRFLKCADLALEALPGVRACENRLPLRKSAIKLAAQLADSEQLGEVAEWSKAVLC
jgi:hypothetical protein